MSSKKLKNLSKVTTQRKFFEHNLKSIMNEVIFFVKM